MVLAQTVGWTTQDVADSFALWWREAGLHSLTTDVAHGWLDHDETPAPPRAVVAEAPLAPAPIPQAVASRAAQPRSRAMPDDLLAFRAWLADDPAQPEAAWTGPTFLPPAQTGLRLLILTDMPDADAEAAALPFAPETVRFLAAMLGAIGLTLEDVGFAPLALRRPPGGLLDDPTFAAMTRRMHHYLGLAAPRAALILGDRAGRALLDGPGDISGGRLPELNHTQGTLPVAALPRPEHLMRRPSAKAASWQVLRLLNGAIAA